MIKDDCYDDFSISLHSKSVNIQQWHDMTCAEYIEYVLLLPTFWIKMFNAIHLYIPWNVLLVPVTSKWTEKNTTSREKHIQFSPNFYRKGKNTLLAKSMEQFEAQWKHSYLTFWFAGNGYVPTTTKYCRFNASLVHSVRGEKYNLQCPKLKPHKII